jgi:hypothetical protein
MTRVEELERQLAWTVETLDRVLNQGVHPDGRDQRRVEEARAVLGETPVGGK